MSNPYIIFEKNLSDQASYKEYSNGNIILDDGQDTIALLRKEVEVLVPLLQAYLKEDRDGE